MSRSLVTNWRSRDSLNRRTRCGWRPWVCQIRCTELTLIPICLAILAAVQWVTSPGGSVCVSATVCSCTLAGSRGIRDGRVLSRSSPSTPCAMKRSCQRHTVTLLLPVCRMIVFVPMPSAVISTMRARHTCFCGLFRSATIPAKRTRSPSLTWTVIPLRMLSPHHPAQHTPSGLFRQILSTSAASGADYRLLQPARHGRAVDQRGQERDQMDAAVLPYLRRQRRASPAPSLAYNLGNFMRTLAMPRTAEPWSLTSLREKLIKIGAKVVSHGRYVTFQMAEVAVPRQMFAEILSLIARLRARPAPV